MFLNKINYKQWQRSSINVTVKFQLNLVFDYLYAIGLIAYLSLEMPVASEPGPFYYAITIDNRVGMAMQQAILKLFSEQVNWKASKR